MLIKEWSNLECEHIKNVRRTQVPGELNSCVYSILFLAFSNQLKQNLLFKQCQGIFVQLWVFDPNRRTSWFYLSSQELFCLDRSFILPWMIKQGWIINSIKNTVAQRIVFIWLERYTEEANLPILYKIDFQVYSMRNFSYNEKSKLLITRVSKHRPEIRKRLRSFLILRVPMKNVDVSKLVNLSYYKVKEIKKITVLRITANWVSVPR